MGLPVFNGEKYLRQALDSLISQDFQNFELIVCDNASTDATAEICRAYAATEPRIRYHRNASNIGSSPNYRRVFELAKGEFFKWSSHDDVAHPRLLSRCLEVFESAPRSVVLVYPLCDLIDEPGKVIGRAQGCVETRKSRPHTRLSEVMRNYSYASPLWGLIRAEALRKTGLTGSTWYWDEVLLAELSLFGEIRQVPEVLAQQRTHQGNALALCSVEQGAGINNNPGKVNRATRKALRAWVDPPRAARPKRIWLPRQAEHDLEYAKRIYHAPLSRLEKLACYATVVTVANWCRFRKLGGLWKRRVLHHLHGSRSVLEAQS